MEKVFKDLFTFPVTLVLAPNLLATPPIVIYSKTLTAMQIVITIIISTPAIFIIIILFLLIGASQNTVR